MSDNINFDLRTLAFVVDLTSEPSTPIKLALYKVIDGMQGGDRVYVYSPGNLEVFRNPGEIKACFATHQQQKIDLGDAIKQCVYIMQAEDADAKKRIVILLDYKAPLLVRNIRRGMDLDARINNDCHFILCTFGNGDPTLSELAAEYPRCTYKHFDDVQDLEEWLRPACLGIEPKEELSGRDNRWEDIPDKTRSG